jgi:hypothetical protein
MIIFALLITLTAQATHAQTEAANTAAVEDHTRDIIRGLPLDSVLRRNLLQGARGDGIHHPWMDEMRKQGIKRAVAWIDIEFDSKGRPTKISLNRTEYFGQYEDGTPISNNVRLSTIRTIGLERELDALALEKARDGFWVDLPRPKPQPFLGGTQVVFLDDEWLPVPSHPSYYTRAGGTP